MFDRAFTTNFVAQDGSRNVTKILVYNGIRSPNVEKNSGEICAKKPQTINIYGMFAHFAVKFARCTSRRIGLLSGVTQK